MSFEDGPYFEDDPIRFASDGVRRGVAAFYAQLRLNDYLANTYRDIVREGRSPYPDVQVGIEEFAEQMMDIVVRNYVRHCLHSCTVADA